MTRRWVAGPESDLHKGKRVSAEDGRATYTFTDCEMSICRSAQLASYTGIEVRSFAYGAQCVCAAHMLINPACRRNWPESDCCSFVHGLFGLEQGADDHGAAARLHEIARPPLGNYKTGAYAIKPQQVDGRFMLFSL